MFPGNMNETESRFTEAGWHQRMVLPLLRLLLLGVLLQLGLTAMPASADGKYYAKHIERVPSVPYQRALIAFDGEREILVVQSKFQGDADVRLGDIGWVVPVPAVPEVGTMSPTNASRFFKNLDRKAQVETIVITEWLMIALALFIGLALAHTLVAIIRLLFSGTRNGKLAWLSLALMIALYLIPKVGEILVLPVGVAASIVYAGFSAVKFISSGAWKSRANYWGWSFPTLVLTCLILISIAIPQFSEYTKKGVDIVKEEIVGKLEIKVIRAKTTDDLTAWLKERKFWFDQADVAVFDSYIAKGWVFVTARPVADAAREDVIGNRGMLAPLVLVFPTKSAIYPLALTATAAKEDRTQVDLYVFSPGKMDAGSRMRMIYASSDKLPELVNLAEYVEPRQLLERTVLKEGFLTRFFGALNAEGMRTDLVLQPAADNAEYNREFVW